MAFLTKKNVLFSLKFPYSAAFLFSWESLAETPFCFFCLISAASHQRLDALVLESGGIGRGQLRRWAGPAAAMGGGCLSEMQYVFSCVTNVSQSPSGIGKRHVREAKKRSAPQYCRNRVEARHFL